MSQQPPPPPAYQAAPPQPPASGKPWYKQWWGIVVIIFAALMVLGGIGNALGGDAANSDEASAANGEPTDKAMVDDKSATKGQSKAEEKPKAEEQKKEEPKKEEPKGAGLNQAARDGKFEFIVTAVKPGVKQIGDPKLLGKKAQGEFVLLTIKVKNIGKEPQTFFGDNSKIKDAEGREFSADTEAMLYLGDQANSIMSEINPGNSLTVQVPFDLPPGAKPVRVELHDSMMSGGVEVRLS
ncbi:MAG: DUF4352 domain-containing protein [Kineosporiaceae bacterium]